MAGSARLMPKKRKKKQKQLVCCFSSPHLPSFQIKDGNSESAETLGILCGLIQEDKTYVSTGDSLWVEFKSDSSASFSGFSARFVELGKWIIAMCFIWVLVSGKCRSLLGKRKFPEKHMKLYVYIQCHACCPLY